MTRLNSYQFFLKHAGYSYNPKTETEAQGRAISARLLAKAERDARDLGFSFCWSIDHDCTSADWIADDEDGGRNRDPWATWQCTMYNCAGGVVNSLHGIDFGRGGEPWGDPYRRVVEAELAVEGLTNEPQ